MKNVYQNINRYRHNRYCGNNSNNGIRSSDDDEPPKIVMNLSGSGEVPPVQTEATGVAEFTPGMDSVAYSVNATNIEGVTAGHIHFGKQRENGPIVVTLFNYDSLL